MSHDSTGNPKNPQKYTDHFARISRAALEDECGTYWNALADIADALHSLNTGVLDEKGLVNAVHEIVCEGLGFRFVPDEAWREKVRSTFPMPAKGNAE